VSLLHFIEPWLVAPYLSPSLKKLTAYLFG
jgi:hypothetical protein